MSWKLAHNIGTETHSNYNTREQIISCTDPIGFDGIYRNVYENKDALLGKTGIFFVMGDYVGKDNTFDLQYVPKLEKYCTWEEINELTVYLPGFSLGWHTWSHPDLTTLSKEQIIKEITPPWPMPALAYPYGRYNELVIECAKEVGYMYGYSVTQGTQDRQSKDAEFKIYRDYIK